MAAVAIPYSFDLVEKPIVVPHTTIPSNKVCCICGHDYVCRIDRGSGGYKIDFLFCGSCYIKKNRLEDIHQKFFDELNDLEDENQEDEDFNLGYPLFMNDRFGLSRLVILFGTNEDYQNAKHILRSLAKKYDCTLDFPKDGVTRHASERGETHTTVRVRHSSEWNSNDQQIIKSKADLEEARRQLRRIGYR